MTGDEQQDRFEPLSEMDEAAPDDLFVGRSEGEGHGTRFESTRSTDGDLYGADDDLYGGPPAAAARPALNEDPDAGRDGDADIW
ncbi:hypothetical protein [Kitasatospora sp. A2-31]|uniref:hypothetical protein n=1 Tax=Kitasatospora sp. A2-31 TaxID=2916414 RepID=UPI001EEB27E2|nr:hypothetical protein [Kitasatospora sp. A2-31]MCG6498471.1 hypothetical protein [Kitasatospora sp. A2-31]